MYIIKTHIDGSTKLADLIIKFPEILDALNLLKIPLGFGDLNLKQIAEKYNLDYIALERVMKIYCGEKDLSPLQKESLETLLVFLRHSHDVFKNREVPHMREMIDVFADKIPEQQGKMLVKFFEGYIEEVYEHFEYEDETVFPHIVKILDGSNENNFNIWEFEENHTDIEQKLLDLRNILIKYISTDEGPELRRHILYSLVHLEKSLYYHTIIENEILVPSVKILENK